MGYKQITIPTESELMNYGFMSFSYPDEGIASLIALAKEYGYNGLELRISADHAHGLELDSKPDHRRAAKSMAADAGIDLYSIATSLLLAADELDDETAVASLKLATDIGARVIRVFGGAYEDKGLDLSSARKRLVAGLKRFGALSRDLGVTVALESHDAWTDPQLLADVLEEVDSPNLGLNWDPFHIVRITHQSIADHFPLVSKWVKHVHVHDGIMEGDAIKITPIGTGIVDHAAMIECLISIGFQGYLMGEWIHGVMTDSTDPSVYLPRELAKLKEIENSLR